LCREEAKELSSIRPQLGSINLVGVVHETLGAGEFAANYLGGDLYLDKDRAFFNYLGNRWLGFTGFFSPTVWSNIKRAKSKGVEGNMEGEGRLLGGLLVIGPGDKGVVFEHREEVWGDHADPNKVLEAVKKLQAGQ